MQINFIITNCKLGLILVAMTKKGICAIFFGDDRIVLKNDLHRVCNDKNKYTVCYIEDGLLQSNTQEYHRLKDATTQIVAFIDESAKENINTVNDLFKLSIDPLIGTRFQRLVWQALCAIPVGITISYSELASQIGKPKAFRAVANACGANLIALLIPCHRVVRKSGDLGGYAFGLLRKQSILAAELSVK